MSASVSVMNFSAVFSELSGFFAFSDFPVLSVFRGFSVFQGVSFLQAALTAVFLIAFALCGVTDIRERRIPNSVVLCAASAGFLLNALMWAAGEIPPHDFLERLLYALASVFVVLLVSVFTDAIGAGDAKILSFFGLYFGKNLWIPVGFGFVIAGVFALIMLMFGRVRLRSSLPMAPFFLISFVVFVLF